MLRPGLTGRASFERHGEDCPWRATVYLLTPVAQERILQSDSQRVEQILSIFVVCLPILREELRVSIHLAGDVGLEPGSGRWGIRGKDFQAVRDCFRI